MEIKKRVNILTHGLSEESTMKLLQNLASAQVKILIKVAQIIKFYRPENQLPVADCPECLSLGVFWMLEYS